MRRPMWFMLGYVIQRRREMSVSFFEHANTRSRFSSYFFFKATRWPLTTTNSRQHQTKGRQVVRRLLCISTLVALTLPSTMTTHALLREVCIHPFSRIRLRRPQSAFSSLPRTCTCDSILRDATFLRLQRSGLPPLLLGKTRFVQYTTPKLTEFFRLILCVRGFFTNT